MDNDVQTARVRVERISQSGDGIESGDVVAGLSADAVEIAAPENLAVRLHHDRLDREILFATGRVRVPRISQSGDRIEPGDVIARLSADAGEKAAHQNL